MKIYYFRFLGMSVELSFFSTDTEVWEVQLISYSTFVIILKDLLFIQWELSKLLLLIPNDSFSTLVLEGFVVGFP